MLQKTNPRIIELQTWIDNHNDLLEIVIPFMEKNPGLVDFDTPESACGTYRCLWGWWLHLCASPEMFGISDRDLFGLRDIVEWGSLFGTKSSGTLSQRKERIKAHVKRFETERDLILSGGVPC